MIIQFLQTISLFGENHISVNDPLTKILYNSSRFVRTLDILSIIVNDSSNSSSSIHQQLVRIQILMIFSVYVLVLLYYIVWTSIKDTQGNEKMMYIVRWYIKVYKYILYIPILNILVYSLLNQSVLELGVGYIMISIMSVLVTLMSALVVEASNINYKFEADGD